MKKYVQIPNNPYNLAAQSLLVPTPVVTGGETGLDFVLALGGDADTFIVLFGMDADEIIRGAPLGKTPFEPIFLPSWNLFQLCNEVYAGVWQVFPNDHPAYAAEFSRRMVAMARFIMENPPPVKDCHICHHDPVTRQICSACGPSCRGCKLKEA